MSNPEIIEKRPITVAKLKAALKDIKKRDGELSFRGNKAEEYANQMTSLSKTKAKEVQDKLTKLEIPRLKDEHIVKIVDILPKSVAELKVVMQGYTVTVSNDNLKKIMDVVKEYV